MAKVRREVGMVLGQIRDKTPALWDRPAWPASSLEYVPSRHSIDVYMVGLAKLQVYVASKAQEATLRVR